MKRTDLQPGNHAERETRRKRIQTNPPQLSRTNAALVERLEATLLALEEAGDPRRSVEIEGQMRTSRPNSEKDEGAPTRWARNLENRIHRQLRPLLSEFDRRVDGSYEPPPKPEKVRCVYTRCQYYGKRIPRFVGPDDAIELVFCNGCQRKLTEA